MISLESIDAIQNASDLLAAIESTYENEEGVSEYYAQSARTRIRIRARELGFIDEINAQIAACEREFRQTNFREEIYQRGAVDRRGNLLPTSENFLNIMNLDPAYSGVRKNEVSGQIETADESGEIRTWSDADSAASRIYIEKEYGLHNRQKHEDAFECFVSSHTYNPIKDLIERQKWDGTPRISGFLSKWMRAEDTPYTREISRLIFAGGINRLYRPGCKFDDMAVLIGEQGCGKSTIVRWLAMEDAFFREVNEFDGQAGMEAIEGAWICEVSELLAMTKAREQEAIKSYLTRMVDSYRRPYARYTTNRPRTCVFIGTTNREEFLVDKTGSRRFYPVHCGLEKRGAAQLYEREAECRAEIMQCWAEARAKYGTDEMAPFCDESIKAQVDEAQEAATEDDYRVGMIESWLEKTRLNEVCTNMIWRQALKQDYDAPTRADCTSIGLIMQNMRGWKRCATKKDFGEYGKQRFWRRIDTHKRDRFDF